MIVQNWMQSGVIQDPHKELFILRIESVMLKSQDDLKIDWDNEFRLRQWVGPSGKECTLEPRILKSLSQTILDAGKSVRLALYFKAHPQNDKVSNVRLDKPCIYAAILEQFKQCIARNFEEPEAMMIEGKPSAKKYARPTFNGELKSEFYSVAEKMSQEIVRLPAGKWGQRQPKSIKIARPLFMENELDEEDLQFQPSLFDKLLSVPSDNMLVPFSNKKSKGGVKEVSMTHADHRTQVEIQTMLRKLETLATRKAQPGYILHKDVKEAYSRGVSLTSALIAANLGQLLHLSFEVDLLVKTVWYSLFN